jgi:hypothetical protein
MVISRWLLDCGLPGMAQASSANYELNRCPAIVETRIAELERGIHRHKGISRLRRDADAGTRPHEQYRLNGTDVVRPKRNSLMPASIEILSLLLAEMVGLPALLHAHSSSEFVMVYTFGIACGGLGSRLSAIWRERVSEKPRKGGAAAV